MEGDTFEVHTKVCVELFSPVIVYLEKRNIIIRLYLAETIYHAYQRYWIVLLVHLSFPNLPYDRF